jgi:hypothetical protein
MPRVVDLQTNFTSGELDPKLQGRIDIKHYYNGADRFRNAVAIPQGGARRRGGLEYIADVPDNGSGNPSKTRLEPFQFSTITRYLLLFAHETIVVYKDGVEQTTVTTPYGEDDLALIDTAQSFDTMIIVHPDYAPRKLTRTSDTSWTLSTITFSTDRVGSGVFPIPQHDFGAGTGGQNEIQRIEFVGDWNGETQDDWVLSLAGERTRTYAWANSDNATNADNIEQALRDLPNTSDTGITVSNVGGGVFDIEFGGDDGKQIWPLLDVFSFNTALAISANREQLGLPEGEDAWSNDRGWPQTVVFHQQRLWFGGTPSLPDNLWGSRIGLFFDFSTDPEDPLPDDAIDVTIESDEVAAIRALVSGLHLQIFTQSNELWVPTSTQQAITPQNIQVREATQHGIKAGVDPIQVSGATMFVQREGSTMREFIFNEVDQRYNALSISLLASHLFRGPKELRIRRSTSTDDADFALMVNSDDGSLAILTTLRDQEITAWTLQTTPGNSGSDKFVSVGVDLDEIYVVTERTINGNTVRYLERWVEGLHMDAGKLQTTGLPTSTVTGLDHLEGETVKVRVDGANQQDKTVSGGEITLDRAAEEKIEVGLEFEPEIKLMPQVGRSGDNIPLGRKKRTVELTLELFETTNVTIDDQLVPLRRFGSNTLDQPPPLVTGRKTIEGRLGFSDLNQLTFSQAEPGPMTILAVEQKVQT